MPQIPEQQRSYPVVPESSTAYKGHGPGSGREIQERYISPDGTPNLAQLAADDEQARQKRYTAAWKGYRGEHPDSIKREPGKPNDNIKINYARLIVDIGVTYLFGQPVPVETAIDDDDNAAAPSEQLDEFLDDFWTADGTQKRSGASLRLKKLAQNGGVCGHTWAKLMRAPDNAAPGTPPRLVALDPANVSAIWNPDDYEDVREYRITWVIPGDGGKPVLRRERHVNLDASWLIVQEYQRAGERRWEEYAPPEPWPYPWSAVFGCQNLTAANEYYGTADLEPDVLDLIYAMNRAASVVHKLSRSYYPRGLAKGVAVDGGRLVLGPEEFLATADVNAALQVVNFSAPLGDAITWYRELKQAVHETSRIPEIATGKLERLGTLSGTALRILYSPLIDKTEDKRDTYGDLVQRISAAALELAGYGSEIDTVISWPEIVPEDPLAEAQLLQVDQQLGVSNDTLMRKRGYDPDQEREKKATESAAAISQAQAAFAAGQNPGADVYAGGSAGEGGQGA